MIPIDAWDRSSGSWGERRKAGSMRILLVLAVLLLPGGVAAAPAASPEVRAAWGFDRSDLAPHPRVRFGLLPNGMRYAVMSNSRPSGGLSVRLRFEVGAKLEGKGEQGHVHLIEHLIFHGTPNIPEGSLPLMLAHRGLRHWSDINAYTSFDETVYRLDMTRADRPAREAALLVMREVAGNLRFTGRVVGAAKRAVLEEIRQRDAVGDAMLSAQNGFFFPGTAIDRGPVAGRAEQVRRARPEALGRLYRLHYVPRRATLIVVGDFDPDLVEAEIAARFSDWRSAGAPAPDASSASLQADRTPDAHLFVHRQAPTAVTIASVAPLKGSDQGRRRDFQFLEHLGFEMLNKRLASLAAQPDPPFKSADAAIYDHYQTARFARLDIEAQDRDWQRALKAGAAALGEARENGFTQAELDDQIAASRRALSRAAAPTSSPALADALVDAVNRRIVFTEPADPAGTEAYLDRVRLDDVNAAFDAAWRTSEPLVFVSHNRRIPEASEGILAEWRSATLGPREFSVLRVRPRSRAASVAGAPAAADDRPVPAPSATWPG